MLDKSHRRILISKQQVRNRVDSIEQAFLLPYSSVSKTTKSETFQPTHWHPLNTFRLTVGNQLHSSPESKAKLHTFAHLY